MPIRQQGLRQKKGGSQLHYQYLKKNNITLNLINTHLEKQIHAYDAIRNKGHHPQLVDEEPVKPLLSVD